MVSVPFRGLYSLNSILFTPTKVVTLCFRPLSGSIFSKCDEDGFVEGSDYVSVPFRGLYSLNWHDANRYLLAGNNIVSVPFRGLYSLNTREVYDHDEVAIVSVPFRGLYSLNGHQEHSKKLYTVSVPFRGLYSLNVNYINKRKKGCKKFPSPFGVYIL